MRIHGIFYKSCLICVFIVSCILTGDAFGKDLVGKFVVAIREPLQNEDGFRVITRTLERGRDTSNW